MIDYLSLRKSDKEHCDVFASLMCEYIAEMNEHSHRPLPKEHWPKWIDSIVRSLGPKDRHLELCSVDGVWIGFLFGKVDHADHKGYVKPGYGYIMEFFVKPEYRRNGVGREMYFRLEALFRHDGVSKLYLTADPVTGKPFWEAMGFENTGEVSPDNQLFIYEKIR